jgi:hypothetical protein
VALTDWSKSIDIDRSKSIDIAQVYWLCFMIPKYIDITLWYKSVALTFKSIVIKVPQGYQVYRLTQVLWHWNQVDAIALIRVYCSISKFSSIPSLVYDEGDWLSHGPSKSQVLFRRKVRRRQLVYCVTRLVIARYIHSRFIPSYGIRRRQLSHCARVVSRYLFTFNFLVFN